MGKMLNRIPINKHTHLFILTYFLRSLAHAG